MITLFIAFPPGFEPRIREPESLVLPITLWENSDNMINYHCAPSGGRTHTSLRIPDFESGASANSAIRAFGAVAHYT